MTADAANVEDRFGLVGRVLEDRFRVDSCIAEGGFGVLYRGRHLRLDKPIAIKVLKVPEDLSVEATQDFLKCFTDEARIIARLQHPAIVRILDFGCTAMPTGDPAPWTVLEWLDGVTLTEAIAKHNGTPFSPEETLKLLQPICDALAYAHEHHVVHRDLKPDNIMLVTTRGRTETKLLDFGIAKLMDPEEGAGSGVTSTQSKRLKFSPQYAAPEQLGGLKTGPWTDVHALGLVFTEMLTGRPAYEVQPGTPLFAIALHPDRPSPAMKGVDVGPWEDVLARAVSLRAPERFPDAGSFLNALLAATPAEWQRASMANLNVPAVPLSAGPDQSAKYQVPQLPRKPASPSAARKPTKPPIDLSATLPSPETLRAEAQAAPAPVLPQQTSASEAPIVLTAPPAPRSPAFALMGAVAALLFTIAAFALSVSRTEATQMSAQATPHTATVPTTQQPATAPSPSPVPVQLPTPPINTVGVQALPEAATAVVVPGTPANDPNLMAAQRATEPTRRPTRSGTPRVRTNPAGEPAAPTPPPPPTPTPPTPPRTEEVPLE